MKKATVLISLLILSLSLTAGTAFAAPPGQDDVDGEAYVVQKGDWLSKIAREFYGDYLKYPMIVEATNAKSAEDDSFVVIENPDLIVVGQKLWLPAATPSGLANGVLSVDVLGNATYQGIYDEPVQLTDGQYVGEPFVEGSASRPTVTFVDQFTAWGDLNGDGVEDAAVILAENSGGSGVFIYVAAVADQDGAAVNQATQFVGDRTQINSLVIENGEIVLYAVTHGPDDPLCCPTLEVTLRFRLEGDQLVEGS